MERIDLNDFLQLCNLVMFVLVFLGFFRFFELFFICVKDIKFSNGFIFVFIEKSKVDQLREGQLVVIVEFGFSLCFVILLKLYMNFFYFLLDFDEYIFRFIFVFNSCKCLVFVNKFISYFIYRQFFKKFFCDIVLDIINFSIYFVRLGGVIFVVNFGIFERNFQ